MCTDLAGWRAQIDEVDREILHLLSRRAEMVAEVGALKHGSGRPVHDPRREAEILARIRDANPGPLSGDAVVRLFTGIIRESRSLESELVSVAEAAEAEAAEAVRRAG
ncbi:MAG: chorismate mutase [Gemmatimonadetes bacterium]|nr:chorismate mutase [Gemmatimonadota bacterium]